MLSASQARTKSNLAIYEVPGVIEPATSDSLPSNITKLSMTLSLLIISFGSYPLTTQNRFNRAKTSHPQFSIANCFHISVGASALARQPTCRSLEDLDFIQGECVMLLTVQGRLKERQQQRIDLFRAFCKCTSQCQVCSRPLCLTPTPDPLLACQNLDHLPRAS